jgi:hypothetical protein
LRFLLDNDVAVTVRRVLLDAGHECWTAAEANLHDAPDDALAVYAADRSVALVSRDAEFARRRRRNTIGQHGGGPPAAGAGDLCRRRRGRLTARERAARLGCRRPER